MYNNFLSGADFLGVQNISGRVTLSGTRVFCYSLNFMPPKKYFSIRGKKKLFRMSFLEGAIISSGAYTLIHLKFFTQFSHLSGFHPKTGFLRNHHLSLLLAMIESAYTCKGPDPGTP